MISYILKTVGAAVLFSSATLAQETGLGRPTLFKDGLSPHVDSVFWQYLQPTPSTYDKWEWGWIPQTCLQHTNRNSLSPYDMEIYNVNYDDCSKAFVFCRHTQAQIGIVNMIDVFGRLPVKERQYVRNVIAIPATTGSAYHNTGIVLFKGAVGTPSVFQHEVGHAVDTYRNSIKSSTTETFINAIQADSCVPDDYANRSNGEDYSQVSVLALFEIVNPEGLDPISSNWRCLENQKNVVNQFQDDVMHPGGTCTQRWTDAEIVSMGPSTGNNKRAVGTKPSAGLVAGMDGVREIPFESEVHETFYTNLVFNKAGQSANSRRMVKFRG